MIQFRWSGSGPVANGTGLEAVGEPDGPGSEQNRSTQTQDAEESRAETNVVDRCDAPDEAGEGAQKAAVVDEVVGEAVLLNPEHDLASAGCEADSDCDQAGDDEDSVDEHRSSECECAQNGHEHENLR